MAIPAAQRETAALLTALAGREPIETHISAVYVGTTEVWKLRKAVRLPFVDFTAPAARERAARRELELNAPAAPGLYRDVTTVTRGADGRLALGGDGTAVDWVVRMARVPAGDFLDAIAARGGLDAALLDGVADAVAACHAGLPALDPAPDWPAALAAIIAGNRASAHAAGLEAARVDAWFAAAMAEHARCAGWLASRAAAGRVRRGHGDLHLGNLCLWHGKPVPFDALEFDEALATADLGYDLAFLLMDLDVRLGRAAANRVMNRYLARTGDWGMAGGLPLYLSVRAMVRAHVAATSGRDAAEVGRYFDRAEAHLRPAAAAVLAVGGLPGAGKSTLARALAPDLGATPGAVVIRSDEIRKRQHGAAPEDRLAEAAYSGLASRAVFAEIAAAVAAVAGAGHAAIADATFIDPVHRAAVEAAAGAVPFLGVWLTAPLAVLEARVAGRAAARTDASDAGLAVLRRAASADPGPGRWRAVEASDGAAAQAIVRAALLAPTC